MTTRRRLALKVSGRKKVCFHLDQLVYFAEVYHPEVRENLIDWQCEMVEPGVRVWGTGVMCGHTEIGFQTLEEAAESALTHIQEMHQAMGGTRLPKGRGKERRERRIAEWNARRLAEIKEKLNGHD